MRRYRTSEEGRKEMGGVTSSVAAKFAVLQGGHGRANGTVASRPIPTPRKRGNPQASDPKRHGDNGHVREAPDGHLDAALLAWKRHRSGTDV